MKDINEKATRWPQIQGVTLHYEEIIKYLLHRHSLLTMVSGLHVKYNHRNHSYYSNMLRAACFNAVS